MAVRAITQCFGFYLWASCLACALAAPCLDPNALERRLGIGLLLRHPQVSNQNSKERIQSIRRREGRPGPTGPTLGWRGDTDLVLAAELEVLHLPA